MDDGIVQSDVPDIHSPLVWWATTLGVVFMRIAAVFVMPSSGHGLFETAVGLLCGWAVARWLAAPACIRYICEWALAGKQNPVVKAAAVNTGDAFGIWSAIGLAAGYLTLVPSLVVLACYHIAPHLGLPWAGFDSVPTGNLPIGPMASAGITYLTGMTAIEGVYVLHWYYSLPEA